MITQIEFAFISAISAIREISGSDNGGEIFRRVREKLVE